MTFYTQRQKIAQLISTLEGLERDHEAAEDFIQHDRKQAIQLLNQVLMNGVEGDVSQKITA
jgi:hypothetical protein